MRKLIEVDMLKQYIGDCKCCDKCPNKEQKQYECYYNCKFPDYLTEEWERVLDEQPIIEAIPIDFIEKKIEEYREKEEKTKWIFPVVKSKRKAYLGIAFTRVVRRTRGTE